MTYLPDMPCMIHLYTLAIAYDYDWLRQSIISSLLFKMSVEQALALWRTQLPLYKRILDRLRDTVLTPLTRFLPPHFEEKK